MAEADTYAPAVQQQLTPEDIVPWLIKSPTIVTRLGVCVTISSLRDVARIRLETNGVPGM
jgi:hypothetical protein